MHRMRAESLRTLAALVRTFSCCEFFVLLLERGAFIEEEEFFIDNSRNSYNQRMLVGR